jgi:repressor LexA
VKKSSKTGPKIGSKKRSPAPGASRRRVLDFVRERLLQGAPPTVREVQAALGFSAVQTAREHLERLVGEGRLAKASGVARGYRLPEHETGAGGLPALLVPLLGRVQAGALTAAIEDPEGHVAIEVRPHSALARSKSSDLFALRVRGDSMNGAAILDGDIVIVRRQPKAEHCDIVVAQVGDEATVKRLKIRRGRVELAPENPAFESIVLGSNSPGGEAEAVSPSLVLLGKVIEVRRYLEGQRPT